MSKSIIAGMFALGLAACSGSDAKEVPAGTGNGAGTGTGARPAATTRTLTSGTQIAISIQDALSSRTNKSGETVRATVTGNVSDSRGNVVIPSGSTVTMTIDKLEPASQQVGPEGRLMIDVKSVTINGETRAISATLGAVPHQLVGRGITTDEAARIAAGTAIGAAAGQIIGKNTKSTVIGGAAGAVAGGAVAAKYAFRDIVISAGTPTTITLTQGFSLSAR